MARVECLSRFTGRRGGGEFREARTAFFDSEDRIQKYFLEGFRGGEPAFCRPQARPSPSARTQGRFGFGEWTPRRCGKRRRLPARSKKIFVVRSSEQQMRFFPPRLPASPPPRLPASPPPCFLDRTPRPTAATEASAILAAFWQPRATNAPAHGRSGVGGVPLYLVAEAQIHDALNQHGVLDAFGQGALREVFGPL